jgi:hypothetical protein
LSSIPLCLLLFAIDASLPTQRSLLVARSTAILGIFVADYTTYDAAEPCHYGDATSLSLSRYTNKFLSRHLARCTPKTKMKAWCKIATSPLLCYRILLAWLPPILLTWIRVSWDDDSPTPRPLSGATAVLLWVIWALWRMVRYVPPMPPGNLSTEHMVRAFALDVALDWYLLLSLAAHWMHST